MPTALAFDDLIYQAGAVMIDRDGVPAPAHYGSPAGELAVCVARLGLAARTDLAVLPITAKERVLDDLTAHLPGGSLAPGGLVSAGDACWCRDGKRDELTLVAPRRMAARLVRLVRPVLIRHGVALVERSDDWTALGLIGRCTPSVLADLGVYGPGRDPRSTAPCARLDFAGHSILVLLLSERDALIVVGRHEAAALWQEILEAGQPYGISCVGVHSIQRYRLTQRDVAVRRGLP